MLPDNFQFSQGSLQDFADCRRRFQLRYIQQLAWPAIQVDPVLEREEHLQFASRFHHLVHQHQLGIPLEALATTIQDPLLVRWWENYLAHPPADLPPARHPEMVLTAPLAGFRLLAKYDLVAVEPGQRLVIVDWKTNQQAGRRSWLEQRMQTKVYRYLLVEAGAVLNGGQPVQPEQIEMIYWFANEPASPIHFGYSAAEHAETAAELGELVRTIQQLQADEFPLTDELAHCGFCAYRSLCDRGTSAAHTEDWSETAAAEELDFELDLEQVAEIEF